ncbi:MAG TPA: M55 family metallopeptidase [Anaerolineales bacterium]|nr:M55 family metallopeptidase [Anaerolineales bacterium]
MKILIAADMEGITGVVNWDQVTSTHSEYSRFRRLMTGDVNAAIEGALAAGASEIIVVDGHSYGYNILIEELNPLARLNSGSGSPLGMVQGIDASIDGVFFVGYHACAGSKNAILDHTWSSATVGGVWLNDMLVGEAGLNAAVCGHFGVPVLMITGDQTVCGEAKALLGSLEVAVVKQASGRMSAECLPPDITREKICEAAARAVHKHRSKQSPPPFSLPAPIQLRVAFFSSDMADRASLLPGVERLNGRELSFSSPDMLTAYREFRAAVSLARG